MCGGCYLRMRRKLQLSSQGESTRRGNRWQWDGSEDFAIVLARMCEEQMAQGNSHSTEHLTDTESEVASPSEELAGSTQPYVFWGVSYSYFRLSNNLLLRSCSLPKHF
jgi:hypothetical protein